jgi:hypothetical protein
VSATSSDTFVDNDVTVNVGEKVTWTNTGGTHNVVFDDMMFTQPASPAAPSGWPPVVSRTFTQAGDYPYYCQLHRAIGMTGVVHVVAAGATPPPGGTPPPAGGGGSPGGGTPGSPYGGGTPKKTPFKVTLRASRSKGAKVRFFGSVRPAQDGRLALIQVRSRGGRYKTIAKARLKHARGGQSTYSLRLRVAHVGVFRAQVLGAGSHSTGTSGTRRVKPV